MRNITAKINAFLREDEGLTMVEYAVGGALIAAGAGVAFGLLGTAISDEVNNVIIPCVQGNCP